MNKREHTQLNPCKTPQKDSLPRQILTWEHDSFLPIFGEFLQTTDSTCLARGMSDVLGMYTVVPVGILPLHDDPGNNWVEVLRIKKHRGKGQGIGAYICNPKPHRLQN